MTPSFNMAISHVLLNVEDVSRWWFLIGFKMTILRSDWGLIQQENVRCQSGPGD